MLMRFEPFREFDRITEDLLAGRRVRQAPVDAYRRGDRFKIALDLPGVDPGSIEVTVEKEVLTVAATRTSDREEGDEVLVAERGHGQFNRQLFLAESLDREQIRAIYHDGVLTINIPVAERAKPRKVEITHVGSVAQAVEAATVTA
jgi:HSP20 family protein